MNKTKREFQTELEDKSYEEVKVRDQNMYVSLCAIEQVDLYAYRAIHQQEMSVLNRMRHLKDLHPKTKEELLHVDVMMFYYNKLHGLHRKMFDTYLDLLKEIGSAENYYFRAYRKEDCYADIFKLYRVLKDFFTYQEAGLDICQHLKGKMYFKQDYDYMGYRYYGTLFSMPEGDEALDIISRMIYENENLKNFSRTMISGMLMSNNTKAHDMVMDLLKSARQSEGLRSSIVESIDLGHVNTYARFIKYIYEENLTRFSSVKRAFMCFTGLDYQIEEKRNFDVVAKGVYACIVNRETDKYLQSKSALDIYIGLYATACFKFEDAMCYILKHFKQAKDYEKAVYLYFIENCKLQVPSDLIVHVLTETANENIKALVFYLNIDVIFASNQHKKEYIDAYCDYLDSTKKIPPKYRMFAYEKERRINKSHHAMGILTSLCDETDYGYERVYRHFEKYPYRVNLVYTSIKHPMMRETLIKLLGSNSANIRDSAFETITKLNLQLTPEEYQLIASFLKTKRSDARKHITSLFTQANEDIIIACSKTLLKDKNQEKQSGAISILMDNYDHIKHHDDYKEMTKILKAKDFVENLRADVDKLIGEEIIEKAKGTATHDFYDKAYAVELEELTYDEKRVEKLKINSVNKKRLAEIYHDVKDIHQNHIGEEMTLIDGDGSKKVIKYGYAQGYSNRGLLKKDYQWDTQLKKHENIMFRDEVLQLLNKYSNEELLLFQYFASFAEHYYYQSMYNKKKLDKIQDYIDKGYYPDIKQIVTQEEDTCAHWRNLDFVLGVLLDYKKDVLKEDICYEYRDIFIHYCAFVYKDENAKEGNQETDSLFTNQDNMFLRTTYLQEFAFYKEQGRDRGFAFKDDQYAFHVYMKVNNVGRLHMHYDLLLHFIDKGYLKKDYLYQCALNTEVLKDNGYAKSSLSKDIFTFIDHKIKNIKSNPIIDELYDTVVPIMLEKELDRTELDTEYSHVLSVLNVFKGSHIFLKTIFKLGKGKLHRGYYYENGGKKVQFSSIISKTIPLETDNQEAFNGLVKAYEISDERLLECTMYNLRFVDFTERYLNMPGLKKAAYYFKAHMNDILSDEEKKIVRRYTDIDFTDLQNGQMDLNWFKESYKALGKEKFNLLYESAKYITDGAKHKRAQYFADAVLGKLKLKDIESRINDKRHQDMLLAYGLLPLRGNKRNACLKRYKRLQLFLKESKQFGAQKRQSEKLKVAIAINNLARNDGFNDVNRFIWHMETALIDEVREVFEPKQVGEIDVYISIENPQKPEIVVSKQHKKLKSIPSSYKKDAYIKKLREVKKDLKDQYARARNTLEEAMIHEDVFTSSELKALYQHPIIGRILHELLFKCKDHIGFYTIDGVLQTLEKDIELDDHDTLTITHPIHLKESSNWVQWQHHMLENAIKQPFKQVFRELYVMTDDELKNDGFTNRFAGYQIEGKKMLGVMKSRGWMINDYDGFEKVNHKSNVRVDMYCYADWFMPSEVESPSLEKVKFMDNKTNKTVAMSSLSPVLFSETMRDIDLVVSVAYVGGVDVLLNHTTMEMRKRILEHNLALFHVNDYSFDKHHINIVGTYGHYSVHLGSGIIHMQGKGMLPVFPVHAQQRGHIFLPFVDEDPKTAEIISKVLMLASDDKIKDPSVLMHLR